MNESPDILNEIVSITGAKVITGTERIQELWGGYGQLLRVFIDGSEKFSSVIVKHIKFPEKPSHRYGWSTDQGHARKLKSYQVEFYWYHRWGSVLSANCRIPQLLAGFTRGKERFLVLEDLNAAGFEVRKASLSVNQTKPIIDWLAEFHAFFMGESDAELWEEGSYWHLATRQEEWESMPAGPLKDHAGKLNEQLTKCPYKTMIHGDAKLANFCLSADLSQVAAVDFQYVGHGCGMRDLVYFLGSCLSEEACFEHAEDLCAYYLTQLSHRLNYHHPNVNAEVISANYEQLYPVAWADFTRFLIGWKPGHQKINAYSKQLVEQALAINFFS